ncbi:MAG: hypothetical protein EXS08_02320 [Planctomycetes bacterium]|nr:hypothetical protein [Planctomycetota bacterium]
MSHARNLGVAILIAAVAVGGTLVCWRARGAAEFQAAQASAPVPVASPEVDGLVIHGFIDAHEIDPRRWSVRAVSLRYAATPFEHRAEVNSRGRFELTGLADEDYRVELVVDGDPPFVLARTEHERPGGEELVLALDPLALRRWSESARATQ